MKFSFARGAPAGYIADMKTLFVLVAVVTLAGSLAWADTSSSSDAKNTKHYGNCYVNTFVDMFDDTVRHILGCKEETLTDKTEVVIIASFHPRAKALGKSLNIGLSKGLQFHMEERIPVAIRVDKGNLIKRDADWSTGSAFIFDEQLARQLLHDLARGQRVAIQVGDERGNVRLNGSGKAVADFRQRIGLPAQETLTPQQRQTLEIPVHKHQ